MSWLKWHKPMQSSVSSRTILTGYTSRKRSVLWERISLLAAGQPTMRQLSRAGMMKSLTTITPQIHAEQCVAITHRYQKTFLVTLMGSREGGTPLSYCCIDPLATLSVQWVVCTVLIYFNIMHVYNLREL